MNKTLTWLVIFLFAIILIQYCNKPNNITKPIIEIKHDTVYISKDTIIYAKPKLIKGDSIPYLVIKDSLVYKPDTNYDILKQQYLDCLKENFSKNIYIDTAKYGLNNVIINDTLQRNKILGRSVSFNINEKHIIHTTTITQPYKPRNQVYVGFGILGNPTSLINGINTNISLKTKSDKIYEISSFFINNQTNFGIGIKYKL
jgi:hypothetical protein